MSNRKTGLSRLVAAFGYSVKGLVAAFRHEAAFRQEVLLLIVGVILACLLPVSSVERILLIGSVVLVMIVELINSAVEAVVDRIGEEHHELAGRAKDMGSAAVFVTLVLSAFVWIMILVANWSR